MFCPYFHSVQRPRCANLDLFSLLYPLLLNSILFNNFHYQIVIKEYLGYYGYDNARWIKFYQKGMDEMPWKSCIKKLISSIPFPTLVFDDSNKVTLSNTIESKAFNWTMLPIPGQSLFDLFPSENASLLHETFLNAIESKNPCSHSMGRIPSEKSAELTVEMIPVFDIDTMSWNMIFIIKEQPL